MIEMRPADDSEWKYRFAYYVTNAIAARPLRWVAWFVFSSYFWMYRTFFRRRFEARLAEGEARGERFQEWMELNDPEIYEQATGRKARTPEEIRDASRSDRLG